MNNILFDYISKTYCPSAIYNDDPYIAYAFVDEHCNYLTETYKEDACKICWDKFITEVIQE